MLLPVKYADLSFPERKSVREQYVVLQNGLCAHCKLTLSEPAIETKPINLKLFPCNMFKYPVHLHHSRLTGMTIGAVHNYCNAYLWQYHRE